MQPFRTKKIAQPLRTKKNTTSQNRKITQPLGTKKNEAMYWDKKKITQPLGTKKSHNFLGQKNPKGPIVSKLVQRLQIAPNGTRFVQICLNGSK